MICSHSVKDTNFSHVWVTAVPHNVNACECDRPTLSTSMWNHHAECGPSMCNVTPYVRKLPNTKRSV